MSYKFGKTSAARLATCHPELQRLFNSLAKDYNISIFGGHRTEASQTAAYESNHSKVQWPSSKHNASPSLAVDAGLYPVDWGDTNRWCLFGGIVLERARQLDIKIRWGGDWSMDLNCDDQTFHDLPHFEIIL